MNVIRLKTSQDICPYAVHNWKSRWQTKFFLQLCAKNDGEKKRGKTGKKEEKADENSGHLVLLPAVYRPNNDHVLVGGGVCVQDVIWHVTHGLNTWPELYPTIFSKLNANSKHQQTNNNNKVVVINRYQCISHPPQSKTKT